MEPLHESDDNPYPGWEAASRLERAHELAMRESWRRFSSRHRTTDFEPFSREWFAFIAEKRYIRHASWIPRLLEFAKHGGERVLLVGNGLGTDALRYAQHDAKVTFCSSSAEDLHWSRRNFELNDCPGTFHDISSGRLPALDDSVDIVALSYFHELPDSLPTLFEESWRVLRPGGKIIAVVPSPARLGWGSIVRRSRKTAVEGTQSLELADLKNHLERYEIRRIGKRHLRRSDMPAFLRWAYFPVMERLFGRVMVVKAIKPIRAALPQAQAA